ncbi:dihydrodipicolinate synthase family protein [Pseudonocardia humida]|uniref:4-hydroxy-tetrahydrodipicolinate synthase n=1 Tax=Pseudonocardia humida TaxID=2800819 RepID=A0ABT1A201_9PSEU|nr:dihydrodipicolinate synthase family protein [Pseudonocardia humida]MCO1656945.1 dihydrodipicolinate synthase family protein [Pseudonocardia humida]
MPASPRLDGVLVPLVTPFTTDGSLALDALEGLARDVLDAGAAGVVALGTTAEAAALDAAERAAALATCARVCAERGARLVVGAGGADTRGSAEALRGLAEHPSVTAALVPVPYYVRPGTAGVLAHFTALAAASPVPLVVYHVPYRTGQALDATTLRELARLPGVVGVKYSASVLDATAVDLLGDRPAGFSVLAGDDVLLGPLLALGAEGGVLASAHLATERFVELVAAWRAGDLARARTLGARLARLAEAAFAEPNPTVVKGALHATGRIPSPAVRLPLLPARRAAVDAALAAVAALAEPGRAA